MKLCAQHQINTATRAQDLVSIIKHRFHAKLPADDVHLIFKVLDPNFCLNGSPAESHKVTESHSDTVTECETVSGHKKVRIQNF